LGDKVYIGEMGWFSGGHGKGMKLSKEGNINIQYYKEGKFSVGNFIRIYSNGDIEVGEAYTDTNGNISWRGKLYKADGTTEPFDNGSK